jgi:putative two-component system response regulator
MKILIAEDNKINRLTLIDFIKELGYNPLVAEDGLYAFELWQKDKPDLIITDLVMPRMNGIELIKKIRENEFDHETYIIVLTAYNDEIRMDESYDGGADDFLSKPFNKKELKQRIHIAERIIHMQQKQVVIYALTKLAQIKDKEIGDHLNRVGAYSKILAKGLQQNPKYQNFMTRQYIDDLYLSCPLHDIGKIGISDQILYKPGPYTQAEREEMQKHVLLGYETILSIKKAFPEVSFLDMGLHITRSHHEKYDGTGYPDGLKGSEIPLSARIVSVADYYDALVSERVYKEAYSHEEAVKMIFELKGAYFDPDIIDVFIAYESEFKKIYEESK